MANTIQIKRKTTTGAPSIGDLADGEMCLVVPDQTLWQRVDGTTLIQINGGGGGSGITYFETIIWAEENGGIAANQDEWSYGNGATGGNIGIPSFWNCEAVGMVLNAETFGTSASVALRINSTTQETIVATQRDNFYDFVTPVAISRGDRISFRTTAVVGTWSDVRVGVVLRVTP